MLILMLTLINNSINIDILLLLLPLFCDEDEDDIFVQ